MIYDSAIIGAGVCGLFASINTKRKKIIVFDKNRGAKKLAITGNNKSNLTNCLNLESFLDHYGRNGNFLRDAFKLFFKDDLIDFLNSIGFETICKNNRVILKNKTSKELADKLLNMAQSSVSAFKPYEAVVKLKKENGIFVIKTTKDSYKAKSVTLAGGGMSYPETGSDGSCYKLAENLGHTIIKPEPFEVPFCAENTKQLQGLSFRNAAVTLKINKKKFTEKGDIIFTHFGISGPAILKLSEHSFKEAKLYINFININEESLKIMLKKENKKISNVIKKFMPERFVNEFIQIDKHAKELSKKEMRYIVNTLTAFELTIKKCSFNRAFVTKGGVSIREINPKTMESKIVKNLFFCGEIMDIQGSIGGFNLQAAFSTGYCSSQNT